MFAIGATVVDKVARYGVFGNGDTVTGTVVAIESVARTDAGLQAIVTVEWDADNWSEWRKPESRFADELAELLAV
jgi:hypothetical protein